MTHQENKRPTYDWSKVPRAEMESLAQIAVECRGGQGAGYNALWHQVFRCEMAAAVKPPRTRAEVDADIAAECREYYDRVGGNHQKCYPPKWDAMTDGWVNRMNSLCSEPTEG